MFVGRVIGAVWATKKEPTLEGLRLLVVRPLAAEAESDDVIVAGDPLGAGIGETVLVTVGRAARTVLGSQDLGWQCAVVGIVDQLSIGDATFEIDAEGRRVPV